MINDTTYTRMVVLDDKGKVGGIASYVNGSLEGDQYWFYPSEMPLRLTEYKNNKANGRQYDFDKNGRIATIREKKDDLRSGWSYEFDRHSIIVAKAHYAVVNGKPFMNGYVDYNTKGEVVKGFELADISFIADTTTSQIPDSVYLTAKILFPTQKDCLLKLGDYDEEFRLKNESTQRLIKGKGHTISAWAHIHDTVSACIRGTIEDVNYVKPTGKEAWGTVGRPVYFEVRIK
jgi:hypothetical protein